MRLDLHLRPTLLRPASAKIDLFAVAGQCGLLEFRHSCDEVLGGLWDATAN